MTIKLPKPSIIVSALACFLLITSCNESTKPHEIKETNKEAEETSPTPDRGPNFNYTIDAPQQWFTVDTMIQDLRVRIIKGPAALADDNPAANVLVAFMENRELDDFTTRNINHLKDNMDNIVIQEKGAMDVGGIKSNWFTYTRAQNGIERDMINYIIPVDGFAYMISGGTNKGSMKKYRETFDNIAKSFRMGER